MVCKGMQSELTSSEAMMSYRIAWGHQDGVISERTTSEEWTSDRGYSMWEERGGKNMGQMVSAETGEAAVARYRHDMRP